MIEGISQFELFSRFGAALLIGLLVGLQREYAHFQEAEHERTFGGTRTFALLGLIGCTAGLVSELAGSLLVLVVVLAVVGALLAVAYRVTSESGSVGLTSEAAAVATVLTGALCYWGQLALAAALGVAMTVLLALKLQTKNLVRKISQSDVYATLTFAAITLIVLPVLPDRSYGPPPFDVLVPYNIWLMVVFISGISFLGYVLMKLVGTRRGVGLTGLLGGLASSTAVTLSFAQRSRDVSGLERPFALAILVAWSVMFLRILVVVAVLNRPLLGILWVPVSAAVLVSGGYCIHLYRAQRARRQDEPDSFKNPFELLPALTFGGFYALILVIAKAAHMTLGDAGIYLSSLVSGLADVDAITLSMVELSGKVDGVALDTAARAIVLAAVSNTLVKGGIVLTAGSPALRRVILPGLGLISLTAIGVAVLI